MLNNEREISLAAELLDAVTQTEEWGRRQTTDPGISATRNRCRAALEKARAYLPAELYMELSDAQSAEVAAHCDVAIMYGFYVAEVIRSVVANPAKLSEYWLQRSL